TWRKIPLSSDITPPLFFISILPVSNACFTLRLTNSSYQYSISYLLPIDFSQAFAYRSCSNGVKSSFTIFK
ncbi:hypothetical protein, partial [Limosilactobacillus reuteri]|uniref:hypothetical protein n=1 Tax=Limosilactobacillus reuteri TaxID=1598 RepID=UPI002AFE5D6C